MRLHRLHVFPPSCSPAPSRYGSPPMRCFSMPSIHPTAAIASRKDCSRSRWRRAQAPKGTERILTFLGPGAIVGELSLIDGLPHLAAAVAVRDTTLSVISRSAFAVFAEKHPEVYKLLSTLLATRLRKTVAVTAGSFLPQSSRVALTLLELAEEFGQNAGSGRIVIRQKIGQRDLAARAGIARETVSRILNDWKRRKLISRVSGYYCLENRTQLQHEAEVTGE